MTSAVALLRGINVGGHRRVPMADLRTLAEEIGLAKPRTYVASGNLVFDTSEPANILELQLEQAIERWFNFPVDVIVRKRAEWRTYLNSNPFPDAQDPKWVWMFVSKRPPADGAAKQLLDQIGPGVAAERAGGVIWLHMPQGATMKFLSVPWDRIIGSPATSRNWRTVQTIGNMLGK